MTLTGLLGLYLLLCVLGLVLSVVRHLVKGALIAAVLLAVGGLAASGLMTLLALL